MKYELLTLIQAAEPYEEQRDSVSRATYVIHAHFHSRFTPLGARLQRRQWNSHKPAGRLYGRVGAWGDRVKFIVDDDMDLEFFNLCEHDIAASSKFG